MCCPGRSPTSRRRARRVEACSSLGMQVRRVLSVASLATTWPQALPHTHETHLACACCAARGCMLPGATVLASPHSAGAGEGAHPNPRGTLGHAAAHATTRPCACRGQRRRGARQARRRLGQAAIGALRQSHRAGRRTASVQQDAKHRPRQGHAWGKLCGAGAGTGSSPAARLARSHNTQSRCWDGKTICGSGGGALLCPPSSACMGVCEGSSPV